MSDFKRTVFLGIVSLLATTETRADFIAQTNLVSNQSGVARIMDPNLVNPWGVSYSPTSPFWVSDNGTGVATLYSVTAADIPTKVGLTVTIPGDGSVTGQVNTTGGLLNPFNGDNFLFVSEDGTISGWRGAIGTTAEVLQLPDANNVYKGAAFENFGGHSYLLSANFHTGKIDVLKGDNGAPDLAGKFHRSRPSERVRPVQRPESRRHDLRYVREAGVGERRDGRAGPGLCLQVRPERQLHREGRLTGDSQRTLGAGDRPHVLRRVCRRPARWQFRGRPHQRL